MPQLADARREARVSNGSAWARLRAAVFPKGVLARAPAPLVPN